MFIKKSLLLLLTVVLVFSCKQDKLLDQNTGTIDLTVDITQYDNSNLGLYKGTFTTNDASKRGTVEVKILENVPSRATLTLSSGAFYDLQSTVNVTSGQDIANLNFVTIADYASAIRFNFSVLADGSGVEITNTTLGTLDSHILIAKETSRAPVVPIAGTYSCTDCGTHPNLGGVNQTFNLLFVGDPTGAGPGTLDTDFTLNGTVFSSVGSADNNQGTCVANGGFNDCPIVGFTTIGAQNMDWTGTHTYDTVGDCSQANGTWTYVSPAYGSLAGTFTSDVQCVPASVGDLRAGGVVFWVDPADNTHGLVCALSDYGSQVDWGCYGTDLPSVLNVSSGPTGPGAEIGDGINNTNGILTDCPTAPAALAARSFGTEWFLPSAKELNEMYVNRATIEAAPGFSPFQNSFYWSATENSNFRAWTQNFTNGIYDNANKFQSYFVRAVRAF